MSLPALYANTQSLSTTDDYHRSANFVSDSGGDTQVHSKQGDDDDDTLLAGNHDGRGTDLAGGYPSAPEPDLGGAGDDSYAGYDPGMAGCSTGLSACHIPGVPYMGVSESPPEESLVRPRVYVPTTSRGYERDEDEYYAASFRSDGGGEDVMSESGSGSRAPAQAAPAHTVPVAVDPAKVPLPDSNPNTLTPADANPVPVPVASPPTPNPNPNPNPAADAVSDPQPAVARDRPPLGTRIVGRVERLAGKVLHDPAIEARGKRHMVRPPILVFP